MSPNILLRVPRSDNDSECLLVQVAATNNSLDLTLQATEGEGTFEATRMLPSPTYALPRPLTAATVSESAISDCRANNSKATDDDLKAILQHLFLKKPPRDPKLVEGLELSAVALGKEAEDGYEVCFASNSSSCGTEVPSSCV